MRHGARFCARRIGTSPAPDLPRVTSTINKQPPHPLWHEWTTRRLVHFHYEDEAAERTVRLTEAGSLVGDAVRVGVSGVEVEGRITAIDGPVLRVTLSAEGARKKMARASASPARRHRGKAG